MFPHYKKNLLRFMLIGISLSIGGILYVLAIFGLSHLRQEQVRHQCDKETEIDFHQLVNIVEFERTRAQAPANEIIALLNDDTTFCYQDPEAVYTALEHAIKDNELIKRAYIGFEPWVYPKQVNSNGFCPAILNQDSCVTRLQLGDQINYLADTIWYQQRHADMHAFWTDPYLSADSVMVTTLSVPLHNEFNRFIGNMGLDIDLLRLSENIEEFRPYSSCLIVMVDQDLKIMVHPNRSYIGRTRLPDAMKRVGINPDSHPLYHAQDRQSGLDFDYLGHRHMAFYYMPVPHSKWMVLLYCPTDEIYTPVKLRQYTYLILAIVGGIIFLIFAGIYFNKYIQERRRIMWM